jgi:hypothetical protein
VRACAYVRGNGQHRRKKDGLGAAGAPHTLVVASEAPRREREREREERERERERERQTERETERERERLRE